MQVNNFGKVSNQIFITNDKVIVHADQDEVTVEVLDEEEK